jgi:hypothetical protein
VDSPRSPNIGNLVVCDYIVIRKTLGEGLGNIQGTVVIRKRLGHLTTSTHHHHHEQLLVGCIWGASAWEQHDNGT